MRKYAARGTRIRIRGRGPRAQYAKANGLWSRAYRQDLPRKYAARFSVYVDKAGLIEMGKEQWQKTYDEAVQLAAGQLKAREDYILTNFAGNVKTKTEIVAQVLDRIWNGRRHIEVE